MDKIWKGAVAEVIGRTLNHHPTSAVLKVFRDDLRARLDAGATSPKLLPWFLRDLDDLACTWAIAEIAVESGCSPENALELARNLAAARFVRKLDGEANPPPESWRPTVARMIRMRQHNNLENVTTRLLDRADDIAREMAA